MSIFRRIMLSGGLNIDIDSLPETQKIYYTATAKVTPASGSIGRVIANKYDNDTGEGVICFNSDVIKIGDSAFYDCSALTNITIPESVTLIEGNAFSDCISLTSIIIPDSVTEIWNAAFYNCSSLTSITIPNGVTSIGSSAFQNCSKLTSITIPDNVTSIGAYAFDYCTSLTSVTIGNGVTTIGNSAFQGCIGELIINSKIVETDYTNKNYPLAYGWLKGSNFSSLIIGNNVTSIGRYAFYFYKSLTSVTIPNSVTSIGEWAFYNCNSLTSVYISDITAWCNISFSYASSNPLRNGCNLYLNNELVTDLTIPNSVTTIGDWAFYGCSLTSVTIPDSVTTIGNSAFAYCNSLTSVYCKATTPPAGGTDMFNNISSDCKIYVPVEAVVAYKSASGWEKYKSYIVRYDFENDVVVIPKPADNEIWYTSRSSQAVAPYATDVFGANIVSNAYDDANECWIIKFDDKVTSIGDRAFYNRNSLISVTIPDGVTTIGESAFGLCANLTSIVIPDSVTMIGDMAFANCTDLASITIPDGVTSIGAGTFSICSFLTSISIPDSVTTIGDDAFEYCGSLTSINIPNGVTSIGSSAFQNCSKLTSITIPDNVTSIGAYAFDYCTSLTSVTIPDSVTSIEDCAFPGCTSLIEFKGKFASEDGRCLIVDGILNSFAPGGLTEYTIPDSVTTIGRVVFQICSSLTSVTIPDSVTSIGYGAFDGCSSLTSVTIGDSVTTIGDYAFDGCSSLASITCYAPTAPSFPSIAFKGVSNGGTLYVPTGSDYSSWMSTNSYYLGYYGWTIEYI